MNHQQIQLVRSSFAMVQPIAPIAAGIFYDRLFAADPSLRALFKSDMTHQGERLMTMIGQAVGMLDRAEALLRVLRKLGSRHVSYGVRDEHYASVGTALIGTLAQGLGEAFTPEVQDAWLTAYGIISTTMQAGAREAELPALEAAA